MPTEKKIVVKCLACGKIFKRFESQVQSSEYHFCSHECMSVNCIPVSCSECGKQFLTNARGVSNAKFCSAECRYARNRRKEIHKHQKLITKTCERCGKQFSVRPSVAKVQRYCSQECSGKEVGKKNKGQSNPKWKPKITVVCNYCGKQFETYPSRDGRRKYCCKTHSVLGNLQRLASGKRTDIEHAMAAALKKNRIAFDEQVVMFDKFMVDFKLADYPIIIQCDGTYWHDRPNVKPRDKGQDAYLTKAGFVVLRFNETQILKNISGCIRAIKATIRNPSQPPLINY